MSGIWILLQGGLEGAGETPPWLFAMFGTAIVSLFSAMMAIIWNVIKRYEKMLDSQSTDLKTLLEGSNRALIAIQQGIDVDNRRSEEQRQSILVDIRELRQAFTSAIQAMTKEIERLQNLVTYGPPRGGERQ